MLPVKKVALMATMPTKRETIGIGTLTDNYTD